MIPSGLRIFVAVEPADMRRSIGGLTKTVRERFGEEPDETGALYVFRNRNNDRLKVLWHGPAGWTVLYRHLDRRRRVELPTTVGVRVTVSGKELAELLDGVERLRGLTSRQVARRARKKVTNQAPSSTTTR